MQFVFRPARVNSPSDSQSGFTLIELIVALSVMGLATTIFMQNYVLSMKLAKLSRDRQIALSIAEEQLSLLLMNPADYVWQQESANSDGVFRIRKEADEPVKGSLTTYPKAMPPDVQAYERQSKVYDQFRWKAFGKLGERGMVYEVFIDVQWERPDRSRDEHITLTGAVSRSKIEPGWSESTQ